MYRSYPSLRVLFVLGLVACGNEPTSDPGGGGTAAGGAGASSVAGSQSLAGSGAETAGTGGAPLATAGGGTGAGGTSPETGGGGVVGGGESGGTGGNGGSLPASAGAAGQAGVVCPADALAAGTSTRTLEQGGTTRTFIVHVPAGYDNSKALPLVLSFHGMGSTPATQESLTKFDVKADAEKFVVVYPQGTNTYSWNAGACCGGAQSSNVDDVGFARAIVGQLEQKLCIDPKRIYASGFSNGGRMTYRLGCQAADLFAAIAPDAGIKSFPDMANGPGCQPSRPIPLMDIMGTSDERIASQPGQVAEWVKINGCTDAAPKETYRQGSHFCSTYSECKAGTSVTFCKVNGVPHTWPIVDGFSATDRVWEFFQHASLP